MTTLARRTIVTCALLGSFAACSAGGPSEGDDPLASTGAVDAADLCAGPLDLSPDALAAAQAQLRAHHFDDPAELDLALRLLADDPEARETALPLVCGQGTSPGVEPQDYESGPTYTTCVNSYLDWCYSDMCGYPEPFLYCTYQNTAIFTCPPRAGAYCTVRCIYNNCTTNL